jgi:hypothetical protein
MSLTATSTRIRPPAVVGALLVPVVVGSALCLAIAGAVRSVATIPSTFQPFAPPSVIMLATIGITAGMIGWLIVRRLASRPAAVLRVLVPAVVLVSLVPDILLGLSKSEPGTTWAGVVGLMAMHLAVAAVAVVSFAKFLPLPARGSPEADRGRKG